MPFSYLASVWAAFACNIVKPTLAHKAGVLGSDEIGNHVNVDLIEGSKSRCWPDRVVLPYVICQRNH
jgi:hypothetical protein